MRQNGLLLQRLAANRSSDGIQEALAGSGGSASDNSSGIKGHLAREAFLRQLADSRSVAAKVQSNALSELGLAAAEPGLMRTYIEKRLPLNDQRTLQHVASMAAFGWEAGFRSDNQELMAFASRLLVFSEQVALDSGRIQLGYLLAGFPDPSPLGFNSRPVPGLRTFSRLAPAQWVAANLAYLKDLDYAETRIAQLATGPQRPRQRPRPAREPARNPKATPTAEERHSECIGGADKPGGKLALGSHDNCFPSGPRHASALPAFDALCTDLIEFRNLGSLLVNSFFGSRTCLAEFTKDSLRTRSCSSADQVCCA